MDNALHMMYACLLELCSCMHAPDIVLASARSAPHKDGDGDIDILS